MKPTVLLFNFSGNKLAAVRVIAMRLGIKVECIAPSRFNLTLEDILESKEAAEPCEAFAEEMLVMCAMPSALMNTFINELKRQKANTPLKAMITETNLKWSANELYRQISAERDAFAAGITAH